MWRSRRDSLPVFVESVAVVGQSIAKQEKYVVKIKETTPRGRPSGLHHDKSFRKEIVI